MLSNSAPLDSKEVQTFIRYRRSDLPDVQTYRCSICSPLQTNNVPNFWNIIKTQWLTPSCQSDCSVHPIPSRVLSPYSSAVSQSLLTVTLINVNLVASCLWLTTHIGSTVYSTTGTMYYSMYIIQAKFLSRFFLNQKKISKYLTSHIISCRYFARFSS